MKVNFWQIVIDHFDTLRHSDSHKMSFIDSIIFFVVPVFGAMLGYSAGINVSKDFYNLSISFFGIFVALLLNFQVAAFGVYNRRREISDDAKMSQNQLSDLELRRRLLKEINSNISYLILISTIAISLFLLLFEIENIGKLFGVICHAIYIHFILTLIMVVKRSHVLFRKEYDAI